MKDQIIVKQEELIKNLTNQILMGEPQTHLQEKQYKVFRAEEKRLREELESLKQQAGEKQPDTTPDL